MHSKNWGLNQNATSPWGPEELDMTEQQSKYSWSHRLGFKFRVLAHKNETLSKWYTIFSRQFFTIKSVKTLRSHDDGYNSIQLNDSTKSCRLSPHWDSLTLNISFNDQIQRGPESVISLTCWSQPYAQHNPLGTCENYWGFRDYPEIDSNGLQCVYGQEAPGGWIGSRCI